MNILLVHNHYQEPGGEDTVFAAELELLRGHGHQAESFVMHNDDVEGMGRLRLASATVWNHGSYKKLRSVVRSGRYRVVHFHNTFPLVSPSAYYAAHAEGAAVVQTLHNFRLLCPNALLFREGKVCEKCLGKSFAWPGVVHGCYRGSRVATAITAAATALHQSAGTWAGAVDIYIALTEFARKKFIAGGLSAERIVVKPNFVAPDPGTGQGDGGYALFVGRLSEGKGVENLLAAFEYLRSPITLKIAGDGPLGPKVREIAAKYPGRIQWLGRKSQAELDQLLGDAAFLVFPSQCYETFGRVIVEAFAKGTPVIATDHGAAANLIENGGQGLLYDSRDPRALAEKMDYLENHPAELAVMRSAARKAYEENYTGTRNHQLLLNIYQQAISNAPAPSSGVSTPLPLA